MRTRWIQLLSAVAVLAVASSARAEDGAAARPFGFTMGIGAGWDLPTALDDINTTSVRFRLGNGLTFEPRVELSSTTNSTEIGPSDTDTKISGLALVTTARMPIMSRGPVDFVALGGIGYERTSVNPEGADNTSTDSVLELVWGLSVEYWFGPRWNLSFTATNPFVSRVSSVDEGPIDDTTTTSTSFGAVFDPNVVVMIHLFY